MTLKLIWLTDPHLLPKGKYLGDYDPTLRLQLAIDYITEQHSDASYCVLSGDLTDEGDAECYQLLHQMLDNAGLPYLPMTGNHDVRETLREHLSLPSAAQHNVSDAFVQYAVKVDGYRLIALDTLHSGSSEGVLCEQRLAWLHAELESDITTPTLLFCHHQPSDLHLPMMDKIGIANGSALLDLLSRYANIKHICFGHVHRPVSGTFRQIGFTSMRATSMQAPLPYPDWNWETFMPVDEAPALGIILCTADSVVIHSHAFCTASEGHIK